jgi:putative hydrolase of the HAD superfamily
MVGGLLDLVRTHRPRLTLPPESAAILRELRADGWCLGVLTNGEPRTQRRKVRALGLLPLVDAVVYATECGRRVGKPDPEAFRAIARRLAVPIDRVVFVGNDERCDIAGAAAVGMHPVLCTAWAAGPPVPTAARYAIASLVELLPIAARVAGGAAQHHAA